MFKKQRSVLAEQLEMRFKIDGTPDNNTLLALKMDPSVNTSAEDGIFSKRTATQQLMMGEYRRRLVRRHKLMCTAADRVAGSSHGNSAGPLPSARLRRLAVLSRKDQRVCLLALVT